MTDDNKHDDKDRKKLSDEEMEDVAGGGTKVDLHHGSKGISKDKKRVDSGAVDHNSSRSNKG
jgi:hypothetical protein